MYKKFLFILILFNLLNLSNFAKSEIIPLIKPTQTKEETEKKLLIDILKPLPKPIEKSVTSALKILANK